MILTGPEILKRVRAGEIRINPFDENLINPASIDLRLGERFFTYANDPETRVPALDGRAENQGDEIKYADGDPVDLLPGRLYLGHTLERVWAERLVPVVDGKSSIGRRGVSVHQTAGYGDPGFDGQYTLEFTVIYPTRLYVGQRIAQMRFHESIGEVASYQGKYVGDAAIGPVPARREPSTPKPPLLEAPKPINNKPPRQVGRGSLVKCRYKVSAGKTEHVMNGEGVVLNIDEKTIQIRVFGGTANVNPVVELPRASGDWSLRYP